MIFTKTIIILLLTTIFVNSEFPDTERDENILLRKLKSIDDTTPAENDANAKLSWSEKIADILKQSIGLFSTSTVKDNNNLSSEALPPPEKPSIIVKCFSEVLSIYKKYVYDKILYRFPPYRDVTSTDAPASPDPKDDVEIVEPRYHGKICGPEGCDVTSEASTEAVQEILPETTKVIVKREDHEARHVTNMCGEGTIMDDQGNCLSSDVKLQRFVFNVPNSCPFGYIMDRRGNCRPLW